MKDEVESVVSIGNERMANFERERLEMSTLKIKEEQKWQDERVLEVDRINNKHRLVKKSLGGSVYFILLYITI